MWLGPLLLPPQRARIPSLRAFFTLSCLYQSSVDLVLRLEHSTNKVSTQMMNGEAGGSTPLVAAAGGTSIGTATGTFCVYLSWCWGADRWRVQAYH